MTAGLIDSHAHLTTGFFGPRLPAVVQESLAELEAVLVIGAGGGVATAPAAVALAREHPRLYATVGLHPHDASLFTPALISQFRAMAREPAVVALGEMGLDYHYNRSPPSDQRAAFRAQLVLARELSIPLVLHIREAWADALEILRDELPLALGGVVHCFTGGPAEAEAALALGLHLGVSGIATYSHAGELREVFAAAPRERLVIETDSPYLSPAPHRRTRPNRPVMVRHVAAALAGWRGETLAEVARATTANARRLFALENPGAEREPHAAVEGRS